MVHEGSDDPKEELVSSVRSLIWHVPGRMVG